MMSPKENSTRCTEGRPRPEEISGEKAKVRTQRRVALPTNLDRVTEAARRSHKTRFTALMHHIDVEALKRVFNRQRRNASAGVDGITVAEYVVNLEANLKRLFDQVHSGSYRPQPVRRAYVP
jgi:retron-type reverse transcriptase